MESRFKSLGEIPNLMISGSEDVEDNKIEEIDDDDMELAFKPVIPTLESAKEFAYGIGNKGGENQNAVEEKEKAKESEEERMTARQKEELKMLDHIRTYREQLHHNLSDFISQINDKTKCAQLHIKRIL